MIFIYLLPLFLLLSGPDPVSVGAVCVLYIAASLFAAHRYKKEQGPAGIRHPLLSAGAVLAAGTCFYLRWDRAALFASLESLPLMPAKRVCGITAVLLSLLSLYGADRLLSLIPEGLYRKVSLTEGQSEKVFIGMVSATVMTLASKCSPFYAFNDWVDPHTMFTVGKGILHGMLPYRDIYEQKGPLILLVHSLGALVSFDSFLGIWIIEIICCFFFLLFTLRILKMQLGKPAPVLIPFIALTVYTAVSFDQGDSAEELCLPLLAFALMTGCRAISGGKVPGRKEWILIGVTSACVLWIKYSMLGFYLGWFLAVYLFFRGRGLGREVLRGLGGILTGIAAVSLPIILWFALAGGLRDLFEVYFYQNMFLYPKTADLYGRFALFRNLFNGLLNFMVFSTGIFAAILVGLLWSWRHDSGPLFRLFFCSFLMMFLVIYFSGRFYTYYPLIFGVFTLYGFRALFEFAAGRLKTFRPGRAGLDTAMAFSLCAAAAGVFLCSGNMRSLAFEKMDYPQYQAKELIEASGIEAPTLMNYGFLDMGVTMAAGLLPNQRFFCSFNLPLRQIEIDQQACLDTGCTDYVLTYMLEIDSPNYELAASYPANYRFAKIRPAYNLYQKISR